MAILLSQASAYNPGNDLWIVPHRSQSRWTNRLDWYLNFLIVRNEKHQRKTPPNELLYILEKTNLPPHHFITKMDDPLIILSEEHLPNRWLIMLPYMDDLLLWTAKIHTTWTGLKAPPFRVFLPQNIANNQFQESWQKHSDFQDYSCVAD